MAQVPFKKYPELAKLNVLRSGNFPRPVWGCKTIRFQYILYCVAFIFIINPLLCLNYFYK
jgi:hypothetical protein